LEDSWGKYFLIGYGRRCTSGFAVWPLLSKLSRTLLYQFTIDALCFILHFFSSSFYASFSSSVPAILLFLTRLRITTQRASMPTPNSKKSGPWANRVVSTEIVHTPEYDEFMEYFVCYFVMKPGWDFDVFSLVRVFSHSRLLSSAWCYGLSIAGSDNL
jgi:hypothetical protein